MEGEEEEEDDDPVRASVERNLRIKAGEVSSGGAGMSADRHALPTVDVGAVAVVNLLGPPSPEGVVEVGDPSRELVGSATYPYSPSRLCTPSIPCSPTTRLWSQSASPTGWRTLALLLLLLLLLLLAVSQGLVLLLLSLKAADASLAAEARHTTADGERPLAWLLAPFLTTDGS